MPLYGEEKRKYDREWTAKRRAEFFSDKSCAFCGSTHKMEIDHIDPELKVSHRIWSWSKARREKELEKCQVLCHECHVKKTKEDMNYGLKHGTSAGYNHYGCRCDDCTNAEVKRVTDYRNRKKWGVC